MSDVNDTEKLLIEVPEYLSLDDESGISTLAIDCGSCQSYIQSCGSSEYGSCSACEGLGCMTSESCSESCSNCEGYACQSPQSCAGGQCGDSQGGCGGCEDGCQDCQSSCQNSIQSLEDPSWTTTVTATTITVKITDPGDYSYFSWSLRTADDDIIEAATSYSTSKTKIYSGLSPNTQYRVYVSWSTSTTGMGKYTFRYVTTSAPPISLWSWTSSNGEATDDQTKAAYSAITNKGLTSKFSYLVWNDLVNKVQEVLDALDDTWNSAYCTKADALMSSSDKTLTATRFNSVRYNIGLRYSTGISEVAKGDSVLGSYFTTMTTSLNAWINSVAT